MEEKNRPCAQVILTSHLFIFIQVWQGSMLHTYSSLLGYTKKYNHIMFEHIIWTCYRKWPQLFLFFKSKFSLFKSCEFQTYLNGIVKHFLDIRSKFQFSLFLFKSLFPLNRQPWQRFLKCYSP